MSEIQLKTMGDFSDLMDSLGKAIVYRLNYISLNRDWSVKYRIDNWDFQFIIETIREDGTSYRVLSPSYDPTRLEKLGVNGLVNDTINLVMAHYYIYVINVNHASAIQINPELGGP